ncbi:retrovirus-related pol polyprotein from transposon TNT 1-94 [Tanacetum coccineum]|uniref:Retrovirus-related pol polyprotein from transposon TNT 1-94 n=1 Tax=Tanacetum coccineum TaxID=301880 RepID=A0ABQ5GKM8_9ASTR
MDSHGILEMDDLESDNESIYRPLISPFLDSDDESDDGEVLNELDEYGNAGNFYRDKIINSIDRDDLAFPCMTGFRKFEEIALNVFCRDQVKPLLNELLDHFEGFHNLFQRDIKVMKEAFEQHDVYLDEIERQNDFHECVDKSLQDELEQVKKQSLEFSEVRIARIKNSLRKLFKMRGKKQKFKLEDENVSLDFKVQSLIKERDNAKMEYKRLFDSIKKTRSQTQKEMDELITHVSEKTYAYGAIRAENQNLLVTISELKARMKNGENGNELLHPVVQIILWIVDIGCSKHMMGDSSLLRNFVKKFMGTVPFGNDNFAAITGYGDYTHGNITICHVIMLKADVIRIYLPSYLWYMLLLHPLSNVQSNLNKYHGDGIETVNLKFGTITDLTKLDLVTVSPKFKYAKSSSLFACERGKSKKASHPPKLIPSNYSKLELLHMDLCGPMRVASVNGKKYILVIVDDFSRFTWVYFLRSKDETPEIIKKFIAQAQLNYKAKDCKIRMINDTEFKNATLKAHYEKLGIMQQFSIARTPQQNGIVE